MKTYTLASPSLEGLLTDDHFYFEGIERPLELFFFRDNAFSNIDPHKSKTETIEVLDKYLTDIYDLFLKKLISFRAEEQATTENSVKLQALLQEIVKTKQLIKEVSEAAIMEE